MKKYLDIFLLYPLKMTPFTQLIIDILLVFDNIICNTFQNGIDYLIDASNFIIIYCYFMSINIIEFILIICEICITSCYFCFMLINKIIYEYTIYIHPILKNPEYYELMLAIVNIVLAILLLLKVVEIVILMIFEKK